MNDLTSREVAVTDNLGNFIILLIYRNEQQIDVSATVYLKLQSEPSKRKLGVIYFHDDNVFHVTRDSSKHYHYASKSYGFNWMVLSNEELNIKEVHLIVDKEDKYIIPIDVMKMESRVLNFKQQGFELQRFLPMTTIVQYKDDSYSKPKSSKIRLKK